MRSAWALWSKPPNAPHAVVEGVLARMPERRVAEVVREREGLGEVLVEAERAGERPGDLAHLDGVGQAGAEVVALVVDEDLRLVLRRRKAEEWMIRSRSRWNSVRVGDAGSGYEPPAALPGIAGIGRPPSLAKGPHGVRPG